MSKKIIICSSVEYAYGFEVLSTSETDITLNPGYSLRTMKAISATLSQEAKIEDQGPFYHQQLTVSSNDADKGHDLYEQNLIFKLSTEDGITMILGSIDEPVRFTGGNKELEGFKVNFERNTIVSLL